MQTAMTAAPLSSKACISRSLIKGRPSRAVPVCRFSKGPVAFKEDNPLEKAKTAVNEKIAEMDSPAPKTSEGDNQSIYKAIADDEYEPGLRTFPAFTRRREHTVGRLAMLGCAAAWAGEVLTGQGPMQQYANFLHVPSFEWTFWATVILAGVHLVSGLSTESTTQSAGNKADIEKRNKGITGNSTIEPDSSSKGDFWQTLLRTELALGRSAMLIFLGIMVVEKTLGGVSPLAHFGLIDVGPLSAAPLWLKGGIALFAAGGVGAFSLFDQNKDPEAY